MTAITLKDIAIYPVVEQQGPFFDVMEFFPTLTKEQLDENRYNILVDSCVGNHKPRPARPFWNMMNSDRFERGLAAAGLLMNDIDYVMCTHLHVDHVGWNTRLENGRWVPTFPKAKYLIADRELAYWTQKEKDDPSGVPWITDSVLPIVEAKRAQVVKSDFALNELIQFIPTPGHTIDHYSVLVGQPGHDALITGDMIHSPIQGKYPELGMRADYDSRLAGQTRRSAYSSGSATRPPSCVWCISPRPPQGACNVGAVGTNSSREAGEASALPFRLRQVWPSPRQYHP